MHIVKHSEQASFAVWITGLPASGKSTLAAALAQQIREFGIEVTVLESDTLRKILSSQPRYDEQAREYFYGSLALIGRILTEHGISVVFDATANRRSYRARARQQIPRFIEVFVECPLEICIRRDPKGIYRKAREGQASDVPGVQAVYEPPEEPDIIIHSDRDNPEEAARRVIDVLISKGFLKAMPDSTEASKPGSQTSTNEELRRANEELETAKEELRALTARLISVQESNNRTLARELHDDISQKLAALAFKVTTLAKDPPGSVDAMRKSLRRIGVQLGKTAGDIHQFSRQLHPSILDDLGLPAALKAECAALFDQHQTPCEVIAENVPDAIPEDIRLCIYRVAQEALRNVGKHAAAERIEVRLIGIDGALELSVVDSGNGFDLGKVKNSRGLGLVSIEERVRMVDGRFSITSQPGEGTSVVVWVPLPRAK